MSDKITILLKEYGFDDKEIIVYKNVLINKEVTAYTISKNTFLHKSSIYTILDRLLLKGFIKSIKKNNKTYYYINSLDNIISNLKNKENIIEEIYKLNIETEQTPNIFTYQGLNGQKEFIYQLYKLAISKKINFAYLLSSTDFVYDSSNLFVKKIITEFKDNQEIFASKKIKFKSIWDIKYKSKNTINEYKLIGDIKFIKDLPSKVTTIITNKFIAFSYTSEKPHIIVIYNDLIIQEYVAYFNLIWKIK